MAQFNTEAKICNIKFRMPDWEIEDEKENQDAVFEKQDFLTRNFSHQDTVTQKLQETNSISMDQETVTQKLSNTATSQIETLDCLVKHYQQDPVIHKLPETNTNDEEKITDDTSNMAPTASTSAADEVGL
jgi:hypothetical protein